MFEMLRHRIWSYAPEHRAKYRKALLGVIFAKGRPVDPSCAFSLGPSIEIAEEPFPYVRAPDATEARCMAIAVRHKPLLHEAVIDFDCYLPEHEELVRAIVQHPSLETLEFGQDCRFGDKFLTNLGYHVQGLVRLEIKARHFASPYCEDPNVCDTFVALAIRNSADTLRELDLQICKTERTFRAISQLQSLHKLAFSHSNIEPLDLRHVRVDELTLYMCCCKTTVPLDFTRVKRLIVHMTTFANKGECVDIIRALSAAVPTLEHFCVISIAGMFPHGLFLETVVPGILASTSLRSFEISASSAGPWVIEGFDCCPRRNDWDSVDTIWTYRRR